MADLHLRPVETTSTSHPQPKLDKLVVSKYTPSRDGVDSNLLILFHGLGDTLNPFAQLGQSLNLAQTAILAIQAPTQIPLLEEPAFEWWPSFDPLGEIIQNPNPTKTLELLTRVFEHLHGDCHWPLSSIHLFGFAQGASLVGELALHLSRQPRFENHVGSVVAVGGGLLSYPTLNPVETNLCLVWRKDEERLVKVDTWLKGFKRAKATQVKLDSGRMGQPGGMPRGFAEWKEIMRFWSQVLIRRSALETGSDVYELDGGIEAARAAGAGSRAPTSS
ncbi:alpha/beta hydrolase [Sporobolomyces koalae]|uniref:alpha/beta hydrolase n=1 Tax=Sporobolomyces koalae TaxID=500713 RepID=UPI003180F549